MVSSACYNLLFKYKLIYYNIKNIDSHIVIYNKIN